MIRSITFFLAIIGFIASAAFLMVVEPILFWTGRRKSEPSHDLVVELPYDDNDPGVDVDGAL